MKSKQFNWNKEKTCWVKSRGEWVGDCEVVMRSDKRVHSAKASSTVVELYSIDASLFTKKLDNMVKLLR
jgi:hypothetical protein